MRWVGAILLALAATLPARAELRLTVDLGWGGAWRAGAINPVYVTIADPAQDKPLPVDLEFTSPISPVNALRFSQRVVLAPQRRTYLVYIRLFGGLSEHTIVVRDGRTGRRLGASSLEMAGLATRAAPNTLGVAWRGAGQILIGCSGDSSGIGSLSHNALSRSGSSDNPSMLDPLLLRSTRVGHLPTDRLPDSIQGYQCLDLLFLNGNDLTTIPDSTQQAIADWVRGGGRLLFWPGDSLLPEQSPIRRLMPGAFGAVGSAPVPLEQTRSLGVLSRIDTIATRTFKPAQPATRTAILPGGVDLVAMHADYGSVAVLTGDLGHLVFTDDDRAAGFWRPVLSRLAGEGSICGPLSNPEADAPWRVAAMNEVVDRLGDIKGIGSVDFSYVLYTMLALAVVVGPIDWFILRRARRQPWTWATTTGWILLVSSGAFYLGHLVRSGDTHFRSVRVIDQSGTRVVGATDVFGLYSARSQEYGFDGPLDWWWEPVDIQSQFGYYRSTRTATIFNVKQDSSGQHVLLDHDAGGRPLPTLPVPIWNLAFFSASAERPQEILPPIEADLKLVSIAGGRRRITGSIRNRSATPLANVSIRWAGHFIPVTRRQLLFEPTRPARRAEERVYVDIPSVTPPAPTPPSNPDTLTIAAGETLTIDAVIPAGVSAAMQIPDSGNPDMAQVLYQFHETDGSVSDRFIHAATDLASQRSRVLARMLSEQSDRAVVYADALLPQSPVKLISADQVPAKEQHWLVVRALVDLQRSQGHE